MIQRYGLLGEHLSHSFSKQIHEQLADYTYDLIELAPDQLAGFLEQKAFQALNVTIPYKEAVIPFLDEIDPQAQAIGAVNTIVNKNGRLCGYNTDFDGMKALFSHSGTNPAGKVCLVLGTGGTSKTARAVLAHLGAREVLVASRTGKGSALTYQQASERSDIQIIVNATPCGMYPNAQDCPIDPGCFPKLEAALDAIYNPLRSRLVLRTQAAGHIAEGGLYMLVAQAVYACEKFLDHPLDPQKIDQVYADLLFQKTNLVLIGMPGSGKSTVGKLLAQTTGRTFVDLDEEIVKEAGCPIAQIFQTQGEEVFRQMEEQICARFGAKNGLVIATGGGAVLRQKNLENLRQNGRLFFLDRPLELLEVGHGRPLAADRAASRKRYEERYPIYCACADYRIENAGSLQQAADRIGECAL
ncbi:MAG: shikimate dehydrogenase [Pygmaiobacter massiliensis]|nr:shikimate dehydrogenase [Pygmaiobacter massiliensis]